MRIRIVPDNTNTSQSIVTSSTIHEAELITSVNAECPDRHTANRGTLIVVLVPKTLVSGPVDIVFGHNTESGAFAWLVLG